MIVGITGHQDRPGSNWAWVSGTIADQLERLPKPLTGLSSLAAGSDQIFASEVLRLGGQLHAIIPMPEYEKFLHRNALKNYERLLKSATVTVLKNESGSQRAFYEAGVFIANNCETLFAVWDGQPAAGFGGTADIVAYAQSISTPTLVFNPIDLTKTKLTGSSS